MHTHWLSVCCSFKAKIAVLFWHSIWQSFKSLLHPLAAPRLQKKWTRTVGIKGCVRVCLTYNTVLSVVCGSSWLFGMLRISHCSSPLQAGMETTRWKVDRQKRKRRQKIRKQSATKTCLVGNTSRTCVNNETPLPLSCCAWRWPRGRVVVVELVLARVGNVDCVIRLVSSVSVGAGAICWAAGLQQMLPKFHSLLLIQLLIKEQIYWPPHRDADTHMDISLVWESGKKIRVQFSSSKNVKHKLTRQVRNKMCGMELIPHWGSAFITPEAHFTKLQHPSCNFQHENFLSS